MKKGMLWFKFYIYVRPFISILFFIGNIVDFDGSFPAYETLYTLGFGIAITMAFVQMYRVKNKDYGTYNMIIAIIFLELAVNIITSLTLIKYVTSYPYFVGTLLGYTAFAVVNFLYMKNRSEELMFRDRAPKEIKESKEEGIVNNYDELLKLKELLDKKAITKEEYDEEKKKILKKASK